MQQNGTKAVYGAKLSDLANLMLFPSVIEFRNKLKNIFKKLKTILIHASPEAATISN